ncbi:RCC1 domain-containing protein [Paenibacillus taichungensis]|uniref:RCC1 domain-containing protein n=1 Tax=Paenibacillus taichungensis TaxID=484184 RepID=UPI003806E994
MKWSRVIKIMLATLVVGSIVVEPSAEIYADKQSSKTPLIYAGNGFSGVVNSDGSVWSWGNNGGRNTQKTRGGFLGRGETPLQENPFPGLASLVTVKPVQISAGSDATYALSPEGEILAWGYNKDGLLGTGNSIGIVPSPVRISSDQSLTNVIYVDGGPYHAAAVRKDGTVWSWGSNTYGRVGTGKTSGYETYATQVKVLSGTGYLTNITSVSAGWKHTVAVAADGTIWAWGDNEYGMLGVSGTTSRSYPVHLGATFNQVKAVSTGLEFTVALKSDGTVWSWGRNKLGQLGDGTLQDHSTPMKVKGPGGQGFLDQIVAIKSGINHTLALRADGTVWSWGDNSDGSLGIGSNINSNIPVQVQFKAESGQFIKIKSIEAGDYHNIAISTDKQLFTWGHNFNGGLGVGDTKLRTAPVKVDWQDSIAVSESGYTTSYNYDDNGRLLRKTISRKDGTASTTYQYTYDNNGNLKHAQIIQP